MIEFPSPSLVTEFISQCTKKTAYFYRAPSARIARAIERAPIFELERPATVGRALHSITYMHAYLSLVYWEFGPTINWNKATS